MGREREKAGAFNMQSQNVLQQNAKMTEKKIWNLKLLCNAELFPKLN